MSITAVTETLVLVAGLSGSGKSISYGFVLSIDESTKYTSTTTKGLESILN